jgi:hypothetical protein
MVTAYAPATIRALTQVNGFLLLVERACDEKFAESFVFRNDVVVGQFGEDEHELI